MLPLAHPTPPEWLEVVLASFDDFLVDHAACERKASATGMAFVVRYPDRPDLLEPMIAFAREELEHFHEVYRLVAARGLRLRPDEKDPYVEPLMRWIRTGRDARLLDRLVLGGVVEARGCERFGLVAEGLPAGELKDFYTRLWQAEARHVGLFLRLARALFPVERVDARVAELLALEADLVRTLPLRPALH
ncbi:tRNA-(ms(2)io(6)A)-hydroxylase [Plesiocystis pacifica SIR-1]|uniref:tRNA-(Ms(2)io(6)A)-hydroxylase n=1 Tax=Plesiocystis pacifica SIR-1 TaxID=391625 RepID=A6FXJ7_9BACT|nr:tRNA-(ms[2]io[6]A)-hydroxylase [Plesiocystis pacifica]EDM81585.1 tRNA-(ms(2)io(6)A)-hydroxylase [Plesiocystis pacifica SIR-1]